MTIVPPITGPKLRDLIEDDIGPPAKLGRQPFWNCPFHDDRTPSLTITPNHRRWKCFGCGKGGDDIAWIMERRGSSFKEAVAQLGIPLPSRPLQAPRTRPTLPRTVKPETDPGWSREAKLLARECAKALAGEAAKRARVWLINRGLRTETQSRWQIGTNPQDATRHGLWIERGITIPWFLRGEVTAINVRRPAGNPRYKMVAGGSRRGLFLGDEIVHGRPTLLVEGEFDALLGWQLAGDIINVATVGSASDRPDRTAILQLMSSPLICVAYDADEAGRTATEFWMGATARAHRVPIPSGKDLTEFHQRGGDVALWLRGQLRLAGYSSNHHEGNK